jgi:hypothetical protein
MLINNQPLKAVTRPLAGSGAGAVLCEGVRAGSLGGGAVAAGALPRHRWSVAGSTSGAFAGGGYQPANGLHFEHTTLIDPVAPGGLGSHPVREPEPV